MENIHNQPKRDIPTSKGIYRVQQADTYTMYTKDGLKHRTNGPALIIGEAEYFYINGEHYTQDEHSEYRKAATAYGGQSVWSEEYAYSQALSAKNNTYIYM